MGRLADWALPALALLAGGFVGLGITSWRSARAQSAPAKVAAPAEPSDPIGAFLASHWGADRRAGPLDSASWGTHEAALSPEACGTCHAAKLADWSGSRHALAMSPGLLMQLQDKPALAGSCNSCHAPLHEQSDPQMAAHGLSCPACHVRGGVMHGPPRRDGTTEPIPGTPHGGFVAQDAFEDSRFCATCHQFEEAGRRMAGVLLEDTFNEWVASPAAAQGHSCQSCHMPGRRHLWRGIHDPDFTEAGLDFDLQVLSDGRARYSLTSSGVGHRFPTYVTPRVTMIVEGFDEGGEMVASAEHVIQRRVDLSLKEQAFDTRLHPGETAAVALDATQMSRVVRVRARTRVEPDAFYLRFYRAWSAGSDASEALRLQAIDEATASIYDVGELARQVAGGGP